ncbi:acyl-CoA dehydrogenase family protein [Orrella sp. JC864]|uniref:acyl-CoA dehydrogenase family protein n=1 Tax=Orrella sp. JC864 TaxID=3120298 RepID=UPI00300B5B14
MQFPAEHERLIALADEVSKNFSRVTAEHDADASFPKENFEALKAANLLSLTVPKAFGGHGLWTGQAYGVFYKVLETIARNCSVTAQMLQVHCHAVGMVARLGKDIKQYMDMVVQEGALFASVGSEASLRADAPHGYDTVLVGQQDGTYRLSGFKGFATLAPVARILLIWATLPGAATTREGMVLVALPSDRDGIELIDNWDTMGMRPTVSWALKLHEVAVAPQDLVGEPGDWVAKDPRTFSLGYAANHVGQAQSVYDLVLAYASKYGGLDANPVVQLFLAEAGCRISGARALVYEAAGLWERGDYDQAEILSMRAMHLAKEAANWAAHKSFDILGSRATHRSYQLDRLYRDIRTFTLHFRSESNLFMLADAAFGRPFHSKTRYDRKLAGKPAAAGAGR